MPLYKENGASMSTVQDPLLRGPPRAGKSLSQPRTLTQKLGTGLVGAERLCLLPVLADQVEPGRAGHGVVEQGRDVLLDLPPRWGENGPECLSPSPQELCTLAHSSLTSMTVLCQTDAIFAPRWKMKCWKV